MFSSVYLACVGFAVLHINFRGSTGYGEDSLRSLPGKCGKQDVYDCILSMETILNSTPAKVDNNRVSVNGGSHGGFLTTHLIGQYPNRFISASTRNPVTNIAAMISCTDIPDWCYIECGINYNINILPTKEHYQQMFESSPINYINKVKTPLLLLLGTGDKRCPMNQAIDYYRLLKSKNEFPIRCLIYPEAQHSLNDKISIECDVWVNTALWLLTRFQTGSTANKIDLSLPDLEE